MKELIQRTRKLEPIMHAFFWILVLLYPYIKFLGQEGGYNIGLLHELLSLAFQMIAVYTMVFNFFSKKINVKTSLLIILIFLGLAFTEYYLDGFFHEGENHNYWAGILTNFISYTSITILFFVIYSLKQLNLKQQELDFAAVKNQEAELRVLKGQINPHFLFNTLNTIYASALEKNDNTPDLILKLSNSFRYIFTDGQKNKVSIKKEIAHIKDYINLQEERLSSKIRVDWNEDVEDEEQRIPPLLFISLVENAFKYCSMLKGEKHLIHFRIRSLNNKLSFYAENPYSEHIEDQVDADWKQSGIGLKNTEKRLQILFPDKYRMEINKEAGLFKVSLTIQL